MQGNDHTRYDLQQYPLAIGDFAPAHRGEDGQYYLLPGLPIVPEPENTPLPEVWKRNVSEGECGLPDDTQGTQPQSLPIGRYEKIVYLVVAALVLLLVFRNLPGVRDWSGWR